MSIDPNNEPAINRWLGFPGSPYPVFVLALIIGTFFVLTLHEGHNWGGDFSQYIHHAKNIAEGKHYLDTGYILSGATGFFGPYAYPPVFPILLAPVYWLNGLDLEALKLVGISCFCLTLMLLPKVFGYQLNRRQQIAIILLTGFNPALWAHRNNILSDLPFMLFCYLSLHLMLQVFHQHDDKASNARRTIFNSCLIGITMYLAYGTREIGIVLPLTILTYDIISTRRVSSISIISISVFSILFFLQHSLLQEDLTPPAVQDALREFSMYTGNRVATSHLDYINTDPGEIANRIRGYGWILRQFWPPDNNQALGRLNSVIFCTTTLMAFVGFCMASRKKITVLEIFFVGYVSVLLLFAAQGSSRYLFPLFPLALYYCVLAYQRLFTSLKFRTACLASYLFMTMISYSHAIYSHSYQELTNGVTRPRAVEVFDFIRNHASQSDTILFRKPRVMALMTGRASVGYRRGQFPTTDLTNRFVDAVGGDYFVDATRRGPLTYSEPPTSRFSEVFRNTQFAIYRYDKSVNSPAK